jgi:hypothetical protein
LQVTAHGSVQVRELGVEVDVLAQELMTLMARALTTSSGHHPLATAQLPGIHCARGDWHFSAVLLTKVLALDGPSIASLTCLLACLRVCMRALVRCSPREDVERNAAQRAVAQVRAVIYERGRLLPLRFSPSL